MLTVMIVASPVGPLHLYADAEALVGLYLHERSAPPAVERHSPLLVRAAGQLADYFAGRRIAFDLPLAPGGTAFQARVWSALVRIPYGATRSYGALAASIGRPAASRAVGAANGRNPISIVIPCHRLIGSTGDLTGYGGGLAAKRWLLDHERAHADRIRHRR